MHQYFILVYPFEKLHRPDIQNQRETRQESSKIYRKNPKRAKGEAIMARTWSRLKAILAPVIWTVTQLLRNIRLAQ